MSTRRVLMCGMDDDGNHFELYEETFVDKDKVTLEVEGCYFETDAADASRNLGNTVRLKISKSMARKLGLIKAEKAHKTIYTNCGIEPCEVLTEFATLDEFLALPDKAVPTLQALVDQVTPENRYPEVSTSPEITQDVDHVNPNNIGSTFDSWLPEEGICEDAQTRVISGTAFLFTETGTEGGYWAVQENGKRGYEGLQTLEDGDDLTVYAKGGSVLWQGVIEKDTKTGRRCHRVLRDGQWVVDRGWMQQVVGGFWVHWVQAGMDPETWGKLFMGNKRCLLKPTRRIE